MRDGDDEHGEAGTEVVGLCPQRGRQADRVLLAGAQGQRVDDGADGAVHPQQPRRQAGEPGGEAAASDQVRRRGLEPDLDRTSSTASTTAARRHDSQPASTATAASGASSQGRSRGASQTARSASATGNDIVGVSTIGP